MIKSDFKIRMYGFGELALAYFPNGSKKAASLYFYRLIKSDAELQQKLVEAGYKPKIKIISPKIVSVFVEYLGEPY